MIRVVDRGSGWVTMGLPPLGIHISQTAMSPSSHIYDS